MMHNPYIEHGCKSRAEYLNMLAEEHDVDIDAVEMLADLLGPDEDFDGLVTMVEDYAEC